MGKKSRLDEIIFQKGWAESRNQAKSLIMAGKIRQGTAILDKPGKVYPLDIELRLESPPKFVSRGGEKLEGFFKKFPFEVSGKKVLDVGASTGGFTDCLLQLGAESSTCVDVGHGQLHYKLQQDNRVINIEKYNAKDLNPNDLPHDSYDIIVMDLSFISLTKVLPIAWSLLKPEGNLIALIKPQFEAEKKEADRGKGVISDPTVRERILHSILDFAKANLNESQFIGYCESPISGAKGNLEYLAGWTHTA